MQNFDGSDTPDNPFGSPVVSIGGYMGAEWMMGRIGKTQLPSSAFNTSPFWTQRNASRKAAYQAWQRSVRRTPGAVNYRPHVSTNSRLFATLNHSKNAGNFGQMAHNLRLEDVSPRIARHMDRHTSFFGRQAAKEARMFKVLHRMDPKIANKVSLYRGLSAFKGFMNWMFAVDIAGAGVSLLGQAAANWRPANKLDPKRVLETGGSYVDTGEAYTQRQMALQAIHNSQLTTRAVLGNEAAFMH